MMSSATKGREREHFIHQFLEQVLPPVHRFGSGDIIDAVEQRSGQVDVVIEHPLLPRLRAGYAVLCAGGVSRCDEHDDRWSEIRELPDRCAGTGSSSRDPLFRLLRARSACWCASNPPGPPKRSNGSRYCASTVPLIRASERKTNRVHLLISGSFTHAPSRFDETSRHQSILIIPEIRGRRDRPGRR
jgi:hypothetical protein